MKINEPPAISFHDLNYYLSFSLTREISIPISRQADISVLVRRDISLKDPYKKRDFNFPQPTPIVYPSLNVKYRYMIKNLTNDQRSTISKLINDNDPNINLILEFIDRVGANVVFHSVVDYKTWNNLNSIDKYISELLGMCLVYKHQYKISCYKDIIQKLIDINPLSWKYPDSYKNKMRDFIGLLSLGFDGNDRWKGIRRANNCYLTINNNNIMTTYQFDDINRFDNYLLNNTKFVDCYQHNCFKPYVKNNQIGFDLCLNIGFEPE